MPLTDLAIRNAKPSTKPVRLADSGGLYLEIAPSGGKWWRFKYRVDGKEKRLSLGVYPVTGLKEAREKTCNHEAHVVQCPSRKPFIGRDVCQYTYNSNAADILATPRHIAVTMKQLTFRKIWRGRNNRNLIPSFDPLLAVLIRTRGRRIRFWRKVIG